ncbi:hypothetical protein [Solibacillus sp.]|uniref:hypothetical protein n=1 Tax=Solibacillus sp. TaxID=1909654 RepID=UPI003314DA4A
MKEFKSKLQKELQHDAPFTDELKQRLLETKPKQKKRNWQVISVSVALCCLLSIILFAQFAPQKSVHTASEGESLLPIIKDATGLEVIEHAYAYLLGEQWMFGTFPLVVEQEAPITYGDYVMFYLENKIIVSTVLGLANNTVTMDEGQVRVNNTVLKVRGLGEKMVGDTKQDPFKNPYYFEEWGVTFTPFTNETIKTANDELVVYHNNYDEKKQGLLTIKEAQLIGKVTAIHAPDELALTLTSEEHAVYEAFKTDYDLERLRDISPVTIVKMFIFSDIEQDFKTYEALYTTVENKETLEVKAYYEKTKAVRKQMFTPELNRLSIARYFNGIENATFEQESDTKGWIVFTGENGLPSKAGMAKNEQGIWQPSFGRPIYTPLN